MSHICVFSRGCCFLFLISMGMHENERLVSVFKSCHENRHVAIVTHPGTSPNTRTFVHVFPRKLPRSSGNDTSPSHETNSEPGGNHCHCHHHSIGFIAMSNMAWSCRVEPNSGSSWFFQTCFLGLFAIQTIQFEHAWRLFWHVLTLVDTMHLYWMPLPHFATVAFCAWGPWRHERHEPSATGVQGSPWRCGSDAFIQLHTLEIPWADVKKSRFLRLFQGAHEKPMTSFFPGGWKRNCWVDWKSYPPEVSTSRCLCFFVCDKSWWQLQCVAMLTPA